MAAVEVRNISFYRKESFVDKLKGVILPDFSNLCVSGLLKRSAVVYQCIHKNTIRQIVSTIKRCFYIEKYNVHYEMVKNSKVLFMIGDASRLSSEVNFKKVVNVCNLEHDTIIVCGKKKTISLKSFFANFFYYYPRWIFPLVEHGMSFKEANHAFMTLLTIHDFMPYLQDIMSKKYNLLVTYYDSNPIEGYVTCLFNNKNVPTATLQHGQFTSWREDSVENSGIEFLSSNSKYHLCWNKYAQEEAIKSGFDREHAPILGIISNIGKGQVQCKKIHNDVFGVVLCHPSWENENIELIRAANILAKSEHKKYYLKLHPNYVDDYFDYLVDKEYCLGCITKGIDVLEYANSVEFSIIGSTSMYVELIYFKHPVIRYSSGLPSDKYRDLKFGKSFSCANEIIDVYSTQDYETSELFGYLCHSYKTDYHYSSFFNKFA